MTEENNVSVEGIQESDVSVQPDVSSQAVNSAQVETQAEKMIPQSKVNEIVGATKKSTYEKAYQDARSKIDAEMSSKDAHNGESQDISDLVQREVNSRLDKVRQEELKAQQDYAENERLRKTAESLQSKIEQASGKYEDFDETTKIDFSPFKHLLVATDSVDNSGDVLYHLCKNPSKFRDIARDLEPGSPYQSMAMKDLQSLSSSLKNNEAAKQKDLPRSPLSQIKPSSVSTDNGKPTMADLRRKYTV